MRAPPDTGPGDPDRTLLNLAAQCLVNKTGAQQCLLISSEE